MKTFSVTEFGLEVLLAVAGHGSTGVTVAEMRSRLRLLDVLEEARLDSSVGVVVSLEDADFDRLKALVERHPFGIIDRRIVDLADELDQIK